MKSRREIKMAKKTTKKKVTKDKPKAPKKKSRGRPPRKDPDEEERRESEETRFALDHLANALPGKRTAVSYELPERLPYDDWRIIGFRLAQAHEWSKWALGDWMNYGEHYYGEEYAQVVGELKYDSAYLLIIKYVAARIDPLTRVSPS